MAGSSEAAREYELDADHARVKDQNVFLMSIVSPTQLTNQRHEHFGIKIRGCFPDKEKAQKHIEKLQKEDKIFDIFMADMYEWVLIPPDPNQIEEQEYREDMLNTMFKQYKESQEKAKELFYERVANVKKDGLDKHLTEEERLPPPMDMFDKDDPAMQRIKAKEAE